MKMKKLNRMVGIILTMCILVSIVLVGVVNVSAETSEDGMWVYGYNASFGYYSLSRYLGTATTATLPEKIDGHTIEMVSQFENGTLRNITIPKSYIYIDFAECTTLKSVTCSREYTDTAVELSDFGAFLRCSNLEKVVLPNKISNTNMVDYDSGDGTGHRWHELDIWLPSKTFKNCKKLKEVTLPDNTVYIGAEAFTNCTSLPSITIPDGVKCIDEQVFLGCDNLSLYYLPASIEGMRCSFSPCETQTYVCPVGSYIYNYLKEDEEYCKEKGYNISFTFINSDPVDLGGDANGDGKLDINDVTLIQMHLAHLLPYNISNGDTNEDGKVSISDATQIQKILVS